MSRPPRSASAPARSALNGDGVLKIDDVSWLDGLDALSVQLRSKAASIGHDRGQLHIGSFDAGTSSVMGLRYQAFGSGAEDPTNVVRADLKTSVGEMSVASASGSQTTDWQDIAMIWELGDSAPTLYLDGKRIQPSFTVQSSGAGAIVAEGPLYIGAGSQDSAAGGWSGLIDEVRFKAEKLDPARLQAEHANQNDPTYFFGFGAEETFDEGHASIIAVPLEATTLPGEWIDLDVLAEAVLPSDNDGVSIQSITQPTNGNVSVINGKIPPVFFFFFLFCFFLGGGGLDRFVPCWVSSWKPSGWHAVLGQRWVSFLWRCSRSSCAPCRRTHGAASGQQPRVALRCASRGRHAS